jgi:hypothetical protein
MAFMIVFSLGKPTTETLVAGNAAGGSQSGVPRLKANGDRTRRLLGVTGGWFVVLFAALSCGQWRYLGHYDDR